MRPLAPRMTADRAATVVRVENLDEHDRTILSRLGYAVARSQLFEYAMLKVLEAQRHDLTVPLDERWSEVERWLRLTAGAAARELRLPEAVVADLKAVVARRNLVVHHAYRFYFVTREKRGDGAVEDYLAWFDDQARMLGGAYNGLIWIAEMVSKTPETPPDDEAVLTLWRRAMPTPVEDCELPALRPEGEEGPSDPGSDHS
jgi:hypothetical protein